MYLSGLSLLLILLLGMPNSDVMANSDLTRQNTESLEILENRAANDNKSAQMKLAIIYLEGNGVEADIDRAIFYYRMAAEQDVSFAQYRLARLYLDGDRIDPDPETAINWLLRAARLGFVQAQLDLSQLYEDGFYTPRDFAEAYQWLAIAASLTDTNLESRLQELEAKMTFTELARAKLRARRCIYRGYRNC